MTLALSRRARIAVAVSLGIAAILLLALAAFPVGWLKSDVEAQLSRKLGRKVSIGTLERESLLSFTPVIRIGDVAIPQAAWAGSGKLATVRSLRVQVNAFALLVGRARPRLLDATGATLVLVRGADGRVNWRGNDSGGGDGPGISLTDLGRLDAVIHYRDAVQDRAFRIVARFDPKAGLAASGKGEIAGNPVSVVATAPAPTSGAWPFRLAITGDAVSLKASGTMATAFDFDHLKFKIDTQASDLKLVDRIIEAGLFGTQPVSLAADVERDGERWSIGNLAGKIGTSDIAGQATVIKEPDGTRLDASLRARRLDFEDLASDGGAAAAIALERAQGLRLVPNTRVNIRKVGLTKGRLAFQIDRIVSARRPSALTSAKGVLTIDGKLLTASPLELGLTKGVIAGKMTVDQRNNRAKPLVTLALDMRGSSIGALFGGDGKIDAPAEARISLTGTGDTLREVVGRADGSIGLVARDGALPAKLASLLGFDIGRTLFADDADRAALRCAVVRLDMRQGLGTIAPLIVDTSHSQTTGRGTIRFPDEALAIHLSGAPKGNSVLRVPGSIMAAGTIRDPQVMIPREVKSIGNVLKGIGRAITGNSGPKAADANCATLSRQAIGR